MNPGLLALYAVVRGGIYACLLLLVGTQTTGALLARERHPADLADPLRERLVRQPARLFIAMLALVLARGVLQLVSLLDPGDTITLQLIRSGLLSGSWGHAWLLQLIATGAALAVVIYRGTRIAIPDALVLLLLMAILWAQTGMGHAAGDNWHGPAGRLLDFAHLLGAGIWLGTLTILLGVALPILCPIPRLPELARVVRAFSVYARLGVVLVVISGTTAAVVYSGASVSALLQSTWGRLLLIKLTGMLGVLAMGWYNWRVLTPVLEGLDVTCGARLRRAIQIELALGFVMLAVTTMLVVSPLPGEG